MRPPRNGKTTAALVAFITQLRGWLDLPDPGHILVVLAVAATRYLDGEPVWLLLVAPPSSGKTEAVGLLDDITDGRLNEVTPPGLLGWSKGKESVPTGLLARIGSTGLVTFGDLSSLLATSDRGGRDAVFGMMRRAYDGHVTRDIAPPGKAAPGAALSWSGRLTVVAAVTRAIDRYAAHADQLGPRWVQCRLPERDLEAKRNAAALARGGKLAENRAAAREGAAKLVSEAAAKAENTAVSAAVASDVEDAALVACWGRAAVPRHGYGRREIDGLPEVEEPPRLVRQLLGVARGLLALGVPEKYTTELVRRVALESMPDARRRVLAALSLGEPLTTAALSRTAGLHRHVARMQAEELEAVGVVLGERQGDEEEDDRRPVTWQLDGDGDLIAEVFAAHSSAKGWHEMFLTHTPPPPRSRRRAESRWQPHVSCHPRSGGHMSPTINASLPNHHRRLDGQSQGTIDPNASGTDRPDGPAAEASPGGTGRCEAHVGRTRPVVGARVGSSRAGGRSGCRAADPRRPDRDRRPRPGVSLPRRGTRLAQ